MCGHDYGGIAFGRDAVEVGHDVLACGGVEVSGGLVGENESGLVEQCTCDDYALLFSARELVWHLEGFGGHSYAPEDAVDACFACRAVAPSGCLEHEVEVGICGAVGQQLEVLEDNAYASAQEGDVAAADGREVVVEYSGAAGCKRYFGIKRFEQRSLAAADTAEEVNKLSGCDAECDVGERHMFVA